jgi:hydrogenase maturation factor
MCLAMSGTIRTIAVHPPGEDRSGAGGPGGAGDGDCVDDGCVADSCVADSCGGDGRRGDGCGRDGTVDAGADPLWRMAEVDFGGVRQWVSLACLPGAVVGDRVLVHVGLAIALVEEEDGAWAPQP